MERRCFCQVIVLAAVAAGIAGMATAAAGAPTLLVSEYNLSRVDEYTLGGTFLRTFIAAGSGGLSGPNNLRFGPDGSLYVGANGAVKRYDGRTGAYLGNAASVGGKAYDVLPGGPGGYMYVAGGGAVMEFSSGGALITSFTDHISGAHGLAWMPDGHLLVANTDGVYGNTLTELDPATGSGTTIATGLDVPIGVTVGSDGRYYVYDYGGAIHVVSAGGGGASAFAVGRSGGGFLASFGGDLYGGCYSIQVFDEATGTPLGAFSPPVAASGIALTPEPASAALLLIGATLTLGRRGR